MASTKAPEQSREQEKENEKPVVNGVKKEESEELVIFSLSLH